MKISTLHHVPTHLSPPLLVSHDNPSSLNMRKFGGILFQTCRKLHNLSREIDGPRESLKKRVAALEKKRKKRDPRKNHLFVEVPESRAFLDTASMPMILTVVGTAPFAKILMMLDESKSQEMIERKIKNASPGQGTVRMLSRIEWEDVREVRPRRPFESKLARPNASIRTGQPLHWQTMAICRVTSRLPWSRRFFSSVGDHHLDKAVVELNKEMEFVFGEPPASSLGGSNGNHAITMNFNNSQIQTQDFVDNKPTSVLSHIGSKGEAQMVDVSLKEISKRVAVASCKVILGREVFGLVSSNQLGKGDVLSVAKFAGICGAKQTSNLIPLCHNISLTHVRVDLSLNPSDFSVDIEGEAASTGKTGVEMEAMTAVSIAGLTVYDMCKAASKHIQITKVQLEHKTGGKSGDWSRKNK